MTKLKEASANPAASNTGRSKCRSTKKVGDVDVGDENNERTAAETLTFNIKLAGLGAMSRAEEEEWRRSLMALARVQEVAGRNGRGGYEAPMASPIASMRRSVASDSSAVEVASPAKMTKKLPSLDEYKEGKPWILASPSAGSSVSSPFTSKLVMEPSRRSWDGHTTTDSVSSTRHPAAATNVVARLMGLDDIPSCPASSLAAASRTSAPSLYTTPPVSPATPPRYATPRRSSSTEARLVQQPLQYAPPDPSAAAACVISQASPDRPTAPSSPKSELFLETRHLRTELRTLLKRLQNLSHLAYDHKRRSAISNQYSNDSSPILTPGRLSSPDQSPRSRSSSSSFNAGVSAAVRKYINEGVPVVVLNQYSDNASPNHIYQDEVEKRLRQLGLQSSEQERKTLKQILDAMHLKGLLRPPASPARSDDSQTTFQVRKSSLLSRASLSTRSSSSLSSTQSSKAPRSDPASTSIVIMKPLGRTIGKFSDRSQLAENLRSALKKSQKSCRKAKLADAQTNSHYVDLRGATEARWESPSAVEAQSDPIAKDNVGAYPVNERRSRKLHSERHSAEGYELSSPGSNLYNEDYYATLSQAFADPQSQVSSPKLYLESHNDEEEELQLHNLLEERTAQQVSDDFTGEDSNQGSPVSVLQASPDSELHCSAGLMDITDNCHRDCSSSAYVSLEEPEYSIKEVPKVCLDHATESSALRQVISGAVKEQSEGICLGDECTDASNKEFLYIEQVLKAANLTEDMDMGNLATRWILGGCRMCPDVYQDLEERWEAAQDHMEEVEAVNAHADEPRDLGGELYRKSRQAAMRRRLIFDCVDAMVRSRLREWVDVMPVVVVSGFKSAPWKLLLTVQDIWAEVGRLETSVTTLSANEDVLYSMLSQDLNNGRSSWNQWKWQLLWLVVSVADAIFDHVLEELLVELSAW